MLVYKNYPPAPEKKFPHFFFKVWTSLINQYEFLLILSLSKAALRIQKKPILRSYAGCVIWNKIILRKLYFVYARNENYNNKQYSEQKEVFTSLSQNFEAKRSVVMKSFLQIDLYVTRIAIKHSFIQTSILVRVTVFQPLYLLLEMVTFQKFQTILYSFHEDRLFS